MAAITAKITTHAVELKQVDFIAPGQDQDAVIMRFVDPAPRVAVVTDQSARAAEALDLPTDTQLQVLLVPLEAANQEEWQRRGREWVESASSAGPVPVRAVLEEGWVIWRPGRAAIVAPGKELDGLFAAVVDFAFHEAELRKLEHEIARDWHLAERDVPLVHDVVKSDLARSEDVGRITQQVILRRMRYARLEPHLLSVPDSLRNSARRAATRLRSRANIENRLEAADAQIEVYEYIYEIANQRRGEYVNFIREYHLEWLIVIVLVIETLVMMTEVCINWWG